MHGIHQPKIAMSTQAEQMGHFFQDKIINNDLTTIKQIAIVPSGNDDFFATLIATVMRWFNF